MAGVILDCGGSDTLGWVVVPVCFVDGGVERGGLVTAVDGTDPVDGEPFVASPPEESAVVVGPTGSDVEPSAEDPVTDAAVDPEACVAGADGPPEPADVVGTGPTVCGPGWPPEQPVISSAASRTDATAAERRIVTPEVMDGS